MLKINHVLIHYHEIALKGRNRIFFEEKLVNNVKKILNGSMALRHPPAGGGGKVSRLNGRILVTLNDTELKTALKKLKDVFGISSYSPVLIAKTDLKEINKTVLELLAIRSPIVKNKTFKVKTKRGYKQFPLNSMEVSAKVGAHILKKQAGTGLKVDIKKPQITINIEILKDKTFIYTKKIKGAGGLPVGASGKMLVLISGGIDSPVASYLMLKRGCELDFIHFHSYPFTDKASVEKVEELLKVLSKYQDKYKLYSVPIIDFQKEIVKKTDAKYRVILYRRLMYKVAEKIAEKHGAKALVSGDSLGQVASQTVESISVIGNKIDMPIMRPLIGFDKEEIIDLAKKINTFNISIEPHGDCCSVFLPKNPVTKARLENILEQEKKVGIDKWVDKSCRAIKL